MKVIQQNKAAYFNYEILKEFTAGLVLTGAEVKSIRQGGANLKSAYVVFENGGVFLKGAQIARYKYDSSLDYDPFRLRKLLLTQKETEELIRKMKEQGVSVIPLSLGFEKKYCKVVIALARGKKKHDKRESIKEKTMKREAERAIKRHR